MQIKTPFWNTFQNIRRTECPLALCGFLSSMRSSKTDITQNCFIIVCVQMYKDEDYTCCLESVKNTTHVLYYVKKKEKKRVGH